jgi:hypothetical protein
MRIFYPTPFVIPPPPPSAASVKLRKLQAKRNASALRRVSRNSKIPYGFRVDSSAKNKAAITASAQSPHGLSQSRLD